MSGLTKKLGPLPVWAWGLILGVGGYFLYARHQAAAATASTSAGTTGILDPNAVDPNTGLTYGQEEASALNDQAAAMSPDSGGGGGPVDSGAQGTVPSTNEFGDFLTFLSDFSQVAQTLGWQPPVASATTAAAAASPPVTASSPPTSTATAHTNPAVMASSPSPSPVKSAASVSALSTLNDLLNAGYKKIPGTTQHGGLPQTGTYVPLRGNTASAGGHKYFVFGTQKTGYHIRQAA